MSSASSEPVAVSDHSGTAKVYIIGVGTADGSYLTPHATGAIAGSNTIVGWRTALEATGDLTRGKRRLEQTADNYQKILTEAASLARKKSGPLALLVLGDPLTYPAGIEGLSRPFAGLETEFIPALGPLQLAAGAAHVSLEDSLLVVYRPDKEGNIDPVDLAHKQRLMLDSWLQGLNLIILSDAEQTARQTARFLIENGTGPKAPVTVGEALGTSIERISDTTLGEAAEREWDWTAVLVIRHG
jgi:precorrin-6B methylase 1